MKDSMARRIYLKVQVLDKRMCDFYDKAFPVIPADDRFFRELDKLCDVFHAKLEKRPITALEITGACATFEKKFRSICMTGRSRGQQARGANQ